MFMHRYNVPIRYTIIYIHILYTYIIHIHTIIHYTILNFIYSALAWCSFPQQRAVATSEVARLVVRPLPRCRAVAVRCSSGVFSSLQREVVGRQRASLSFQHHRLELEIARPLPRCRAVSCSLGVFSSTSKRSGRSPTSEPIRSTPSVPLEIDRPLMQSQGSALLARCTAVSWLCMICSRHQG